MSRETQQSRLASGVEKIKMWWEEAKNNLHVLVKEYPVLATATFATLVATGAIIFGGGGTVPQVSAEARQSRSNDTSQQADARNEGDTHLPLVFNGGNSGEGTAVPTRTTHAGTTNSH